MGDMASYIAWRSDIIPVPIDVAIDKTYGDVLGTDLWPRLVRARKVIGAHAGPPCETYSLARWLESPTGKPRPLRTRTHPWGLPFRSLKEVEQTVMGNILFLRGLAILILVYLHGGATTLEHPKGSPDADDVDPEQPFLPWCIWHSAFIKQMLKSPSWRTTCFLQGPLGAPFAKPTIIVSGRLHGLASAIFAAYDSQWRPTSVLGGLEHGRWKTAAAKAYPPRLCEILADQFIMFAQQQVTDGSEPDPSDLDAALAVLACQYDPYSSEQTGTEMRADYFRGQGLLR